MTLGEKIRYLRDVEGTLRGLGRPLSQQELLAGIEKEVGEKLSQSYISQIEGGQRPHLTNKTRSILARFFKVHPGFLVEDPPGFHTDLQSDLRATEGKLDVWLLQGAERFHGDKDLSDSLHCRLQGHAAQPDPARRDPQHAEPVGTVVAGAQRR
jgi:transcriptional regulator with XRE-family HTH domain